MRKPKATKTILQSLLPQILFGVCWNLFSSTLLLFIHLILPFSLKKKKLTTACYSTQNKIPAYGNSGHELCLYHIMKLCSPFQPYQVSQIWALGPRQGYR